MQVHAQDLQMLHATDFLRTVAPCSLWPSLATFCPSSSSLSRCGQASWSVVPLHCCCCCRHCHCHCHCCCSASMPVLCFAATTYSSLRLLSCLQGSDNLPFVLDARRGKSWRSASTDFALSLISSPPSPAPLCQGRVEPMERGEAIRLANLFPLGAFAMPFCRNAWWQAAESIQSVGVRRQPGRRQAQRKAWFGETGSARLVLGPTGENFARVRPWTRTDRVVAVGMSSDRTGPDAASCLPCDLVLGCSLPRGLYSRWACRKHIGRLKASVSDALLAMLL